MPTPATNINTPTIINVLDYKARGEFFCEKQGTVRYGYEWLFCKSTNNESDNVKFNTFNKMLDSSIDNKFIKLSHSFTEQFKELLDVSSNLDFITAKFRMSTSLNMILEINPSSISMEVTHEQSVFYTVKKADYTFYLQHFLNDIDEDEDEAILTIFKGRDKLPSFAGSLKRTFVEINNLVNKVSNDSLKIHEELHELSV